MSTSIHSCLENAPVQGEQLAKMKALLLGQDVPCQSSKPSKAISRSHGSTPVLGTHSRYQSSRPELEAKIPSKKNLSGHSLLPEQPSRWQPSPIPQNRRWDAENKSSSPLKSTRLSGRRAVNTLTQSEHCRWSSNSLLSIPKNTRSSSTGITSSAVVMHQTVQDLSPMRGRVRERVRDTLAQSEHGLSRWNSKPIPGIQRSGSDLISAMKGCPTSPEAIALNALIMRREGDKRSYLKGRGHDMLSQSEHIPSRRISSNILGIQSSVNAPISRMPGYPISPEAVTSSAPSISIGRHSDNCTSVNLTRGPGSSTRLSKPQASLGQLKRSRLSLANITPESVETGNGGMNSTWNVANDIAIVSSSLSSCEAQTSSAKTTSTNRMENMFASIVASSSDKNLSNHKPTKNVTTTPIQQMIDLDAHLISNMSRGQEEVDNFQNVAVVDVTTLAPRNKSDLREIIFRASVDDSMRKSHSIDRILQPM